MGPEVIDDIVGTDVLGISARRLDLLALPKREDDEPDEKQAECDSEPLVQCHHESFVGRIRASVQISHDHLSLLQWERVPCEHGIDAFRIGVDDAQQYLGGRVGAIASLFPVLNRV